MSGTNGFHGLTRAGLAIVPPSASQLESGARYLDRIKQVGEIRAAAAEAAKVAPAPPQAAPAAAPERFSEPKPFAATDVLSPSSLNQFLDCQTRWFYRRVLGLPDKRGAALALGAAVHKAVETNFRQKIETKEDLPAEGVTAVFMDAFTRELDSGVELEKTDCVADLREAGEIMTRVYMEQCAPRIQPAAIEVHVSGKIGDVPVQGFIDLLDTDGQIVDLKTAKAKPSQVSPGYLLQVSTYAMIEPRSNGRARLDTLTKTKTVGLHSQSLEIGQADRRHAERLYSIAREQMQTGLFIPNRGSHLCSRKYCAYWEKCQADYGGQVR